MSEWIRVDRLDEAAACITLDRPAKRNALSIALRDEVTGALAELAGDPVLKCAVVTGSGDFFSAGFDLAEFRDPALSARLWESSDRFHHALLRFPLPLLAAVNGPALAGGFDLAVCCDLRIAAESARFAHPEFAFGDVVYAPLHDLVGGALAREICLTGRELDAQEALARGLVSEVVPRAELDTAILGWTRRIARAPRDRLLRSKAKAVARAAIPPDRATLDL